MAAKPAKSAVHGLFIGINAYPGDNKLFGCVNDALDWQGVFARMCTSQKTLLDGEATKAKMVAAIKKMTGSLSPGGFGILTYSGHGSWVPDQDGDEPDGRDEVLCPFDCEDNLLLDDEIHELLSDRPANTKILLITDSCHSGSVYRVFRPQAESTSRIKFMSPDAFTGLRALKAVANNPIAVRRATAGVIHLSGCKDTEYSYDSVFSGRPNGALTRFATRALKKGITAAQWYAAIRKKLPTRSTPQTPLLNATAADKQFVILR